MRSPVFPSVAMPRRAPRKLAGCANRPEGSPNQPADDAAAQFRGKLGYSYHKQPLQLR